MYLHKVTILCCLITCSYSFTIREFIYYKADFGLLTVVCHDRSERKQLKKSIIVSFPEWEDIIAL